jgi:hypothetical protein
MYLINIIQRDVSLWDSSSLCRFAGFNLYKKNAAYKMLSILDKLNLTTENMFTAAKWLEASYL